MNLRKDHCIDQTPFHANTRLPALLSLFGPAYDVFLRKKEAFPQPLRACALLPVEWLRSIGKVRRCRPRDEALYKMAADDSRGSGWDQTPTDP